MVRVAHIATVDISLRYLLLNQMCSLMADNYEVTAISSFGPNISVIEERSIRHITVPITRRLSPLADLLSLWKLYRLMRRERFVIVHTHTPKPGLLGQLAARLAQVPIVVNTLHGFYFHDDTPPLTRQFYMAMEKIAALCSDVILSQNSEDIDTAIKEGICSANLIKFLGNGIDLNRFNPQTISEDAVEQTRKELGIDKQHKVIGFVGRLVAEKGFLELLTAAKQILNSFSAIKFLIVGPIDREKADAITPDIAAEYGLEDVFIFTGMRQDMPELYSIMDIFVLPSHREGYPRSAMEASAMGIPSILTDIRGCREVVEHGRNGLLIPPKNPQALADAITYLLSNHEERQKMGGEGKTIAYKKFDEQLVFKKVKAEYERLLCEKGLSMS